MFHTGKVKRMNGKGFITMPIEAGETDMAVKLTLDLYHTLMTRLWEKSKHMSATWTNWDTWKGSACFEGLFKA